MTALHEIIPLNLLTGNISSGSSDSAGSTVPLLYYYVTPQKRECMASLSTIWSSSDSGTFDCKLQESATTVDSDFSDITSGAFTQIVCGDADSAGTASVEQIFFGLSAGTKHVRAFTTIASGSCVAACNLWLVKREA